MLISTGMDNEWGLGFSKTGFKIRLLLTLGFAKDDAFVHVVDLVEYICGERFGEDEVTRSDEKTLFVGSVLGVLPGRIRGPQENVKDFFGRDFMQLISGMLLFASPRFVFELSPTMVIA